MHERVAFLCLGTMGFPMAGHLARSGRRITVYNRSAGRAEAWAAEYGGAIAATPAAATAGADTAFICTGDDPDLQAIVEGPEGALAGLRAGAVLVDHTTASAELTRRLAADAKGRGIAFLDAPVSGGQAGAEEGRLTVMVGGEREAFERVHESLRCYAQTAMWMGPSGAGQLTKMVNQICIAGLLQSLSEGLRFAECAGLDPRRVVEVISRGAAQSWQMDHRAESMLEDRFDFGFAVDWMRKDLRIALEEAGRNGAPLPVAALVDGFNARLQERGGGRWDTSSLIRLLRDAASPS